MGTLVIGGDHHSPAFKSQIIAYCQSLGWQCRDIGAHGSESCDYPLIAAEAGRLVARGEADLGILLCGTGVGMSIAANKIGGVRCVCCSEPYSAAMSRLHNDANMLAIGTRVVGPELAKMIVKAWLDSEFEGGRHSRRLNQIADLEA